MPLQLFAGVRIILIFQGVHDGLMFIACLILKCRIQVGEQPQTFQLKCKGIISDGDSFIAGCMDDRRILST